MEIPIKIIQASKSDLPEIGDFRPRLFQLKSSNFPIF